MWLVTSVSIAIGNKQQQVEIVKKLGSNNPHFPFYIGI